MGTSLASIPVRRKAMMDSLLTLPFSPTSHSTGSAFSA